MEICWQRLDSIRLYSPIGNKHQQKAKSSVLMNLLELELIQTQMAQKPMLRAEVGMRVRCANNASAE
jgi:hypothetical protein